MQAEIALCGMITISSINMAPTRGGQCDVARLMCDVNTTACGCVIRSLSPASNATEAVSAAVDVGYLRLPEDPRDLYTYLGGTIGVVPSPPPSPPHRLACAPGVRRCVVVNVAAKSSCCDGAACNAGV